MLIRVACKLSVLALLITLAALSSCSGPASLSGPREAPASRVRSAPPLPSPIPPPVPPLSALPSEGVRTAPAAAPATVPLPRPIMAPESSSAGAQVPAHPVSQAFPPGAAGIPKAGDGGGGTMMALVLPLQSASYGRAAEAVRDGFLAAARAARSQSRVRVYPHGDDGVLPAIAAAAADGAALVVGPLVRDDVKSALALDPTGMRLLVLNHLDDGSLLPRNAYALSLSVESDAVQLAHAARAEGAQTLADVVSSSPLQRRFRDAFVEAWQAGNAIPVRDYTFDAAAGTLPLLRRELSTHGADAVLLAVEGSDAALVKTFLPPAVPVYASSQIVDDQPSLTTRDLDNVRYVEIPWLADPGNPAFTSIEHPALGSATLNRLYALGVDAFAIAQMLAESIVPDRVELDGATGHLSLSSSHEFTREGQLMVFRDGVAVPYAPTGSAAAPSMPPMPSINSTPSMPSVPFMPSVRSVPSAPAR